MSPLGSAEAIADLSCSAYSRVEGIDPIGTAGSYRGYLLVEWPLPWPQDMSDVPELAPVSKAAQAVGLRFQGLVASSSERRSVICYDAPPGPFRNFTRRERVVAPDQVIPAAMELIAASNAESFAGGTAPEDEVRDVLVCTHGRRDRCCGSLGTTLAIEVAANRVAAAGAAPGNGKLRIWRTSHTGGHRFAPNAIVLPEGTVWGYLDADRLAAVLRRSEPAAQWLDGYRGCSGLAAPELQILERAALAEVGWALLDASRSGRVEKHSGVGSSGSGASGDQVGDSGADWSKVTLDLSWNDGSISTFSGEVAIGRRVPIPDCGQPIDQSHKVERELALRHFRRRS